MIVRLLCLIMLAALAACDQQSAKDPTSYPKRVEGPALYADEICYEGVVYLTTGHGITVKFERPPGGLTAIPALCPREQSK